MNYYINDPDHAKTQVNYCQQELFKVIEKIPDKEKFEKYFNGFIKNYELFLSRSSLVWEKIKPIPAQKLKIYSQLPEIPESEYTSVLNRLVVIKLNGGLGTTMGCSYPKSLITVKDGNNFLDITIMYLNNLNAKYKSDIPLVLMNSFSTDEKTNRTIHKYKNCGTKIHTFVQSQYPRISADTLLPLLNENNFDDTNCWFPPGHGNFYESFYESGLMKKFIDDGRDIAFISNIDNLGATIDLKILHLMCHNYDTTENEFLMELTDKTKADVKGGTLIEYEGSIRLMELAQVPSDHIEDFKLISNFTVFNTNNIWLNLRKIHKKISKQPLELDVIPNTKAISEGVNVIQLETAIGAAVKNFKGCLGINVPRSRFLPVKNNSDLLLIMSNLYDLVNGELKMNPKRVCRSTPIIQLSGAHFKTVKDFLARFHDIPNILELDHLAISGDVFFSRNVTLKGTVIILAQHGDHIDIPSGSILENKVVSGNMRILDH